MCAADEGLAAWFFLPYIRSFPLFVRPSEALMVAYFSLRTNTERTCAKF